jgi:hypothetical protein
MANVECWTPYDDEEVKSIKFLKKGVRLNGKYISCIYSHGDSDGFKYPTCPEEKSRYIIVILKTYKKFKSDCLSFKNDTDFATDYFEKSKIYVFQGKDPELYQTLMELSANCHI